MDFEILGRQRTLTKHNNLTATLAASGYSLDIYPTYLKVVLLHASNDTAGSDWFFNANFPLFFASPLRVWTAGSCESCTHWNRRTYLLRSLQLEQPGDLALSMVAVRHYVPKWVH